MMHGDSVGSNDDLSSDKLTFEFSCRDQNPRTHTRVALGQCHLDQAVSEVRLTIKGSRLTPDHSDLYYRDPALFGRQSTVDRYVEQIAAAFSVPRSCLNVVCTSMS
jgi:DNA topoisomerase VI subunit A